MEEAMARQLLVTACCRLLTEWREGHDWRWYGRKERWFELYDLGTGFNLDKAWADYASLSAAWSYLDSFVDSMNHGFGKFDRLSWEEAVDALADMKVRLEAGQPVEDVRVLAYSQTIPTSARQTANGWKWTLALLPVAFYVQMFCLAPVGWTEGAAMCNAALKFDVFVLARSMVGLVWQRQSSDWRIYCGLQFAIIPIIYILTGLMWRRN